MKGQIFVKRFAGLVSVYKKHTYRSEMLCHTTVGRGAFFLIQNLICFFWRSTLTNYCKHFPKSIYKEFISPVGNLFYRLRRCDGVDGQHNQSATLWPFSSNIVRNTVQSLIIIAFSFWMGRKMWWCRCAAQWNYDPLTIQGHHVTIRDPIMVELVHFTTDWMMGDLGAPWIFLPHRHLYMSGDHVSLLF